MGGQGVARQQGMDIPAPDQGGKGGARVGVKGAGGAQHPDDVPMVPLMPEQLINGVVIHRVGRLTGAALAEGEGLLVLLPGGGEAVRVDIDALGAVLRPA